MPEQYAEQLVESMPKSIWNHRKEIQKTAQKAKQVTSKSVKVTKKVGRAVLEEGATFLKYLIEGGGVSIACICVIVVLFSAMLLCGSSSGDQLDFAMVATSQIGNMGGRPYWSWYGYESRVEWCACFVSWCANECGYLETGICPKFAGCESGVLWFQQKGQFVPGGQLPMPGNIIFFDWKLDGRDGNADHVGIVTEVKGNYVITVEGNVEDACVQKVYAVNDPAILGFGYIVKNT